MPEVVTPRDELAAPGWIRWAVALLLLGGAASLVVQLQPRWYEVFGPYPIVDVDLVVDAVTSITLFILPAAVLIGSDRWAAGRRWLWWGAVALAVVAVGNLVREAWFAALAAAADPGSVPSPAAWATLWLGGAAAMVVGHVLLAAGLRGGAGGSASAPPPAIRVAGVVIGLASLVVLLASAWTAFAAPWNGIEAAVLATVGGLLLGVGYASLGMVAVAALQSMPRRAAWPEVLIAVGATVAMLGGAGIWVLPMLVLGEVPEMIMGVFIALRAVATAGLVLLSVGFALGAVEGPRSERAAAPA